VVVDCLTCGVTTFADTDRHTDFASHAGNPSKMRASVNVRAAAPDRRAFHVARVS
jgi:hypothetical protein